MLDFLPVNQTDLKKRGLDQLDIIIISGDAYVDHPSFGPVLIARYLESHGFKVGIIPQPDWKKDEDFLKLGKPRLFFGISAGNHDSLVANYTADKKIRRTDMYSPGDEGGKRPDRAVVVYTNKVKQLFPDTQVVIGGIEASLRRFAHYDYWEDKVRRSILFDSKADLLVFGMGEEAVLQIARSQIQIPNTAIITKDISEYKNAVKLPSFEEVSVDKNKYAEAFRLYHTEGRKKNPSIIIQPCQGRYLVVFPPRPLTQKEFEALFELPFRRAPHPRYKGKNIPAWDFVRFSTVSHRGCFGGCAFCAISQHQGKYVISRSLESIQKEIKEKIIPQADFKGNIFDVGGPTSNMYGITCSNKYGCARVSCIYPEICAQLEFSQRPALELLRKVRKIPGVKNLFIGSGIRYDLALSDAEYLDDLAGYHVGGQLSVAPEHICDQPLRLMNKPSAKLFVDFWQRFKELSKKHQKRQFLIPYLMSSHPGTTLKDALSLALFLKKHNLRPEQVQNFTPTPMTVSACMYYTGMDPFTGEPVHVPKGEERSFQKALLQPYLKKNYRQLAKALKKLKRADLLKTLTS